MSTATAAFDTEALKRAVESRDAEGQLGLFAEDATVEVVDKENPPSRPLTISGRDAIREFLVDVASRDMTHSVSELVVTGGHGAYSVDCKYPDGTRVLCMATIELSDGRIQRQRGIQVWDE
jgi:hypothetical protein